MKGSKIKMLVEAGLMIAMAQILSIFVVFKMPQGGSIHAASMLPLLIFAFRWGGAAGILTATSYGLLHFIIGAKYSLHPLSIFLDYILGYGMLGVAGFFNANRLQAMLGAAIALLLRMCCSVISGAVVFGAYAPEGQNPWIYSIIYNATYIIPEGILTLIVLFIFYKKVIIINKI